jgi:hypothetical protein
MENNQANGSVSHRLPQRSRPQIQRATMSHREAGDDDDINSTIQPEARLKAPELAISRIESNIELKLRQYSILVVLH